MGYSQGIPYSYRGNTPNHRSAAAFASVTPTAGEYPIIQLEPPVGTHLWVTKIAPVGSSTSASLRFVANRLPATTIQAGSTTITHQSNFNEAGVSTTTVMKSGETNNATTPVNQQSLNIAPIGNNNSSRSEIVRLPSALYISPGTFFVLSLTIPSEVLSATIYWVEKS